MGAGAKAMDEAMEDCARPEPMLEIIPDSGRLTVAITLDRFTTFQIAGWTEQILELARALVAADSKWMPGNIRAFAEDALAFRRTRVFPMEDDAEAFSTQAANEAESEQARRTLEALKRLRSFVRGVFYEASELLKKQAAELAAEQLPGTVH